MNVWIKWHGLLVHTKSTVSEEKRVIIPSEIITDARIKVFWVFLITVTHYDLARLASTSQCRKALYSELRNKSLISHQIHRTTNVLSAFDKFKTWSDEGKIIMHGNFFFFFFFASKQKKKKVLFFRLRQPHLKLQCDTRDKCVKTCTRNNKESLSPNTFGWLDYPSWFLQGVNELLDSHLAF